MKRSLSFGLLALVFTLLQPAQAATVSWRVPADGNWNDPANWSPRQVPGPGDEVLITLGGTYTVTLDVDASVDKLTMGAFSGTTLAFQTLAIGSQTLTLDSDSAVTSSGIIAQAGGMVTGAGKLTVNGKYLWTGGTITGVGTVSITSAGVMELSGSDPKYLKDGRVIANEGTITLDGGGDWEGSGGAQVNNQGTFDIKNQATLKNGHNGQIPVINNSGNFLKSDGSYNTIEWEFNNQGGAVAIAVQALVFTGGGTSSGPFTCASGTKVDFAGEPYTLNNGTIFNGPGSACLINGGQLILGAGQTAVVASGAEFSIYDGQLSGTGEMSVLGEFTWYGGTMTGGGKLTIGGAGGLGLVGSYGKILANGWTIDNGGSAAWTDAGTIFGSGGAVINNTGTFDVQADASLLNQLSGAAPIINNTGIFKKSAGTATTCEFVFNNLAHGRVQAEVATLSFTGGGTGTGAFDSASGAKLDFAGAAYALQATALFTGTGTSTIPSSGTLTLDAGSAPVVNAGATLILDGGVINGTGLLTVHGAFKWRGGYIQDGSQVTVSSSASLSLEPDNYIKLRDNSVLNNAGTATWTGAGVFYGYNGSVFNNSGDLTIANDSALIDLGSGPAPKLVNTGTITKTGGGGRTDFGWGFEHTGGLVTVSQGRIRMQGGGKISSSVSLASGTEWQFDGGTTLLAASAHFMDSGTPRLVSGVVNLDGLVLAINFTLDGGTMGASAGAELSIANACDWTGTALAGPGSLRIGVNGVLSLGGGLDKLFTDGWTIKNSGTAYWTGGAFKGGNAAAFNNSGLFEIRTDSVFDDIVNGGRPVFNNTGTLRKTTTTGDTTVEFGFVNYGRVEVQAGRILFPLGATLNDGSIFSGAGLSKLTGGTFDLSGTLDLGNAEFAGGVINGSAALANKLVWTGGRFTGPGALTITASGILELAGTGVKQFDNGYIFQNNGAINWLAGDLRADNNSVINNAGLLDLQGDLFMDNLVNGAVPVVNNAGTFKKSAGSGAAVVEFIVNNNGTLEVAAGSLRLTGGGSSAGIFSTTGGATVEFTAGSPSLQPGASFTGAGFGVVDGANLELAGLSTAARFEVRSGLLSGSGQLNVTSQLYWTGGDFAGTGKLVAKGSFGIGGGTEKQLRDGWEVSNEGAAVWTGAGDIKAGSGASFSNSGSLEIQADVTFADLENGAPATFNNTGILRKSTSGGTAKFNASFMNPAGGQVQVQAGGLELSRGGGGAGGYQANPGTTLAFTGGTQSLGSGASLAGDGLILIDGATMSLGGTLRLSGTGELRSGSLQGSGRLIVGVGSASPEATLRWTGGSMDGAGMVELAQSGILSIEGSASKQLLHGWTILNGGKVLWSGSGNLEANGGSKIRNDGLFELSNSRVFDDLANGAGPTFENSGTLRKLASGGDTLMEFGFVNSGTVEVQTGRLLFQNGATVGAGSKFTGAGQALLAGGAFSLGGLVESANLGLSGGTLTGFQDIQGSFYWSGGTLAGPGTLTVKSGSTLYIQAGGNQLITDGFVLKNFGTVNWYSGAVVRGGSGAEFQNQAGGVFHVEADARMNYSGSGVAPKFSNEGLLSITGEDEGGLTWNGAVENRAAGRINVDVAHGLNIGGTFANLGSAILSTESRSWSDAPSGGKVTVAGAATLGGILRVDLNNEQAFASRVRVLEYASVTGTFASVDFSNAPEFSHPAALVLPTAVELVNLTEPQISELFSLDMLMNSTAVVSFTVNDDFTSPNNLVLTVDATDTTVFPAGSLTFGGSGQNRTLTVRPATGQYGEVFITVHVTNDGGLTSDSGFRVRITPVSIPTQATGANLIINGDAEAGAGSGDGNPPGPLPGWRTLHNLLAVKYGASGGFPEPTSPGPVDRGQNFFAGGPGAQSSSASQVIDVSAEATRIDAGDLTARLSGHLGGFSSQGDSATLLATFKQADGTVLGSVSIGPVTATERDSVTGLLARSAAQLIPAGTRRIDVELNATFVDGSFNDGYADNLSLVLAVAPAISPTANVTLAEDDETTLIITLSDSDTPAADLVFTAQSSNPSLLPPSRLILGGAGLNRTLRIAPLPDQTGTATVTLAASDEFGTTTRTFLVTVTEVNDPPVVLSETRSTLEGSPLAINAANLLANAYAGVAPGLAMEYFSNQDLTGLVYQRLAANVDYPNAFAALSGTPLDGASSFSLRARGVIIPAFSETYTFETLSDDGVRLRVNGQLLIDNFTTHGETLNSGAIALNAGQVYEIDVEYFQGPCCGAVWQLFWSSPSQAREIVPAARLFHPVNESGQTVVFDGVSAHTPGGGTVSLAGGIITYTPAPNFSGLDRVTYTVKDDGLTDGLADPRTGTGVIDMVVQAVNSPPTITRIADQNLDEDSSVTGIPFTVGDPDNALGDLSIVVSSANQSLVPDAGLQIGGSGANLTLDIHPAAEASGVATVTVTVSDGALSASAIFQVFVAPRNDAPVLGLIADQTTNEDTAITVALSLLDVDTPLNQITVTGSSSSQLLVPDANINITGAGSTRQVTLTPAANQSGQADITLSANDGMGGVSGVTFKLTVNPVNDGPTITSILPQAIDEDTSTGLLAFTVADVETPATGLVVTASSSDKVLVPDANVVLTPGAAGAYSVVVTPAHDQTGLTTITLTVKDADNQTASTTFVVAVNPINDAPVITAPGGPLSVNEDTRLPIAGIVIADVDVGLPPPPLQEQSVNRATIGTAGLLEVRLQVAHGNLSLASTTGLSFEESSNDSSVIVVRGSLSDLNFALATLSYLPYENYFGPDTLDLLVNDLGNSGLVPPAPGSLSRIQRASLAARAVTTVGGRLTATRSLAITVLSSNDLPVISEVADQSIPENGTTTVLSFIVDDVETLPGSLLVSGSASNPVLVPPTSFQFGGSGASRTVQVTPAAGQSGVATITLKATDTDSGEGITTFTLTVIQLNQPPTISHVADISTAEEQAVTVSFTVGDLETAVSGLQMLGESANKTLVPDANIVFGGTGANRTATITPAKDQTGTSLITLKVRDGSNAMATDSFLLTVTPVNDAPVISLIADVAVTEDTPSVNVPFTVSDVDNQASSLVVTAVSSNEALVPNANVTPGGGNGNRTLALQPLPNAFGMTRITVTVSDGSLTASTAFDLRVDGLNDLPVLSQIPDLTTEEDVPVTVNFQVSDVDSPLGFMRFAVSSTVPSLVSDFNATFTGTGTERQMRISPVANQSGKARLTLFVTDDSGGVATRSFDFTVTPVNDRPSVSSIGRQVIKQGTTLGPIDFTIGDVETPATELNVSVSSSLTALVPATGLKLGGTGANRTLTVIPSSSQFGLTTITLSVSDGEQVTTSSFELEVEFVNTPPELLGISNQVVMEDTVAGPFDFAAFDQQTPPEALVFTARSSDPKLVPVENIRFGGSGLNRTVTITPATNQFGEVTITLVVKDTDGGETTSQFELVVLPVNDVPSISKLDDQTLDAGTTSEPLAFTVGDVETAAAALKVSAASSNPDLLPVTGIPLGGAGAARTVILKPAPGQAGEAKVTLTVTDGEGGTSSSEFLLTVKALPPVIRAQPRNVAVKAGGDATFEVRAEGIGLAYQWFRNDEKLDGETSAKLVLKEVAFSQGGRFNVVVSNAAGPVPSDPAMLTVLVAPTIRSQPAAQRVAVDETATFNVTVNGTAPLRYQWQFEQKDIPGQESPGLTLTKVQTAQGGLYRLVVSNDAGSATSDEALLTVTVPPGVAEQPKSQTARPGERVVFQVRATGGGPFQYQWRLNGVNIKDETKDTLVVDPVTAANSGSYTVVISSPTGTATSDPAVLTVIVDDLTLPDNFADRVLLPGSSGSIRGSNANATRESGEPIHGGRRGTKSVWAKWVAPFDGVATFSTTGSSFDTVLAVYEGPTLVSLVPVASDEDSGGFLTSRTTFNVRGGTEYSLAVDGFAGVSGTVVLNWDFTPTPQRVPRVIEQPQSLAVAEGGTANFLVRAEDTDAYLWYHNDDPLPTQTGPRLTITGVKLTDLGQYVVALTTGGRTIFSRPARLDVNVSENGTANGNVTTEDKYQDAVDSGGAEGFQRSAKGRPRPAGGALARGYTGTQIFNTYGSTTEENEPNHCGVIGGASQWFTYRAEADGNLLISTGGSDFDTILAVYTGPGTDFESLVMVACDNDSGPNGITSLVRIPVVAGTIYYIAVDGVKGATGTVKLTYALDVPLRFNAGSIASLPNGQFRLQLSVANKGNYTIQSTTNMVDWNVLATTNIQNGTISINDTNANGFIRRFYRAIFVP